MMSIEFIALTFDIIGKIMIAYTALKVHHRFRKEHRVDDMVFTAMKKEQTIGILGIVFIILGYLIHVYLIV